MTGIAPNPERIACVQTSPPPSQAMKERKKQEHDDISHRKQNALEHLHGSQLLNYSVAGENRTFFPTDNSTLSN